MRQSQAQDTIELTSSQVLTMTIDSLVEHFNLVVNGHKFSTEDIWNVIVAASAQGQAIESTMAVSPGNGMAQQQGTPSFSAT